MCERCIEIAAQIPMDFLEFAEKNRDKINAFIDDIGGNIPESIIHLNNKEEDDPEAYKVLKQGTNTIGAMFALIFIGMPHKTMPELSNFIDDSLDSCISAGHAYAYIKSISNN